MADWATNSLKALQLSWFNRFLSIVSHNNGFLWVFGNAFTWTTSAHHHWPLWSHEHTKHIVLFTYKSCIYVILSTLTFVFSVPVPVPLLPIQFNSFPAKCCPFFVWINIDFLLEKPLKARDIRSNQLAIIDQFGLMSDITHISKFNKNTRWAA